MVLLASATGEEVHEEVVDAVVLKYGIPAVVRVITLADLYTIPATTATCWTFEGSITSVTAIEGIVFIVERAGELTIVVVYQGSQFLVRLLRLGSSDQRRSYHR